MPPPRSGPQSRPFVGMSRAIPRVSPKPGGSTPRPTPAPTTPKAVAPSRRKWHRASPATDDDHSRPAAKETDMDLKLNGKTALVTGGSEGIGKGIARALAKEGVDVAICARRKEPLEQVAAEIAAETKRKIVPIPADLTKDADARNFVERGHKALGRVDIMVNNAGSSPGGVIEHLTEADWEQSLQLKFMGYVRCLRYVLPIMVK